MEKRIVVKLTIPGLHFWPEAFYEVKYLAHQHRHTFYIRVEKTVSHNDRDIEIINFKTVIKDWLVNTFWDDDLALCDFGKMSCEDIAERILTEYDCDMVEVLEDNENGAKICK